MNFGDRRDSHMALLRNGKHSCLEMQNDYDIVGKDNFEFRILEDCGEECIDDLEDKYIKAAIDEGLCYNKRTGGRKGFVGPPMTESAKRIIGEKNRVNMLGRKHSEETKKKMSKSHKDIPHGPMSEEQKQKISIILSGENGSLSKLKEDQVIEIRRLRQEEGLSFSTISRQFGVTPQCISDICHYKRWKYTQ